MERMVWISDAHRDVGRLYAKTLWPKHMARLHCDEAEALYRRICQGIELAFHSSVEWLRANGPWNFLGGLGDLVSGSQEQGINDADAERIARRTSSQLSSLAGARAFALGNHETGYSSLLTLRGAGLTLESLEACESVFGPLWWVRKFTGLSIIGVCSPLAEYRGDDHAVLRLKLEQRQFVGDTLESLHGDRWIFAAHRLRAPVNFARVIHGHEQSLQAFVHGDMHNPRTARFLRPFSYLLAGGDGAVTSVLQKAVACPSVAPLWWKGYGLLTMEWDSNSGELTTEQVSVLRPSEAEELPTESALRCAWWMRPARMP